MRSFVIHAVTKVDGSRVNFPAGRYISENGGPGDAVRKMFTQINRERGHRALKITVRESTRGSAHKTFKYKVSKVNQRTEVELDGETVVFKFTTKVKAVK